MSFIKKKKVSKKRKIAWRKHADIQDVERFLEDKRLDERLRLSEKSNNNLFIIDTGFTQNLTPKQKRRLALKESIPKCFSMLQPHSQIPDPLKKRNRVKTKEERKNSLIRKKDEERRKNGILKAKEVQSLKDRKSFEEKVKNKTVLPHFNDIWEVKEVNDTLNSEWIEIDTRKNILKGEGKLRKSVPKSMWQKKSVLPVISLPHPGTSYNPTFQDHQALLKEVAEKETKIIHDEKHLERVTQNMFKKISEAENQKHWVEEMSQGLEKGDDDPIAGHYTAINPPVQNKKKDKKKRRIQKEQQQIKHTRKLAIKEKKKLADMYKLRFIKDELDKKEQISQKLQLKRLEQKNIKAKEPKRLGAVKYEEPEIDINMPHHLAGNLRNLKKEGNLLLDRFKSLQKRNIIQPTTIQSHTKAKIKRFKRAGHKDDWKVTVARQSNTRIR